MKNRNRIPIIAALAAIILISCPQEPDNPETGNPDLTVSVCTVTTAGAYYVNGTKRGNLDIPTGAQFSRYFERVGCTITDGKVYVWGPYSESGADKYAYWVDGVRTDITSPAGNELYNYGLIAISDGKVYVRGRYVDAGTTKDCYWVDGVLTDLDIPNGYSISYSYSGPSAAVSDGRVYVAGSYSSYHYDNDGYRDEEESRQACYWVDGVRTDLSVPAGIEFSETRNITVSGGKVYVLGSYGDLVDMGNSDYSNFRYIGKACYWIDEVRTDLNIPAGTESSEANAITVSAGKVYVSGSYGDYEDYYGGGWLRYMGKACYWVDGVQTALSVPDGTEWSEARNIIVSNGKIYMLGNIYNGSNNYANFCYWVNGTRTDLIVPNDAEIAFWAEFLTVSDGKVYVYGDTCPNDRGMLGLQYYRGAFYWVDGVKTNFDVDHRGSAGFGRRYFIVTGGKVHIAASAGYTDVSDNPGLFEMGWYWINGVKQTLPDVYNIAAISLSAK